MDRMKALECYEKMQDKVLARVNEKVKEKGITKGDFVIRYNSKLDKTFQKKFQIKWEGPFLVLEGFPNGTYQLADMDGTPHAARVNGLRLKIYHASLMMIVKDQESEDEVDSLKNVATCEGEDLVSLFAAFDHE